MYFIRIIKPNLEQQLFKLKTESLIQCKTLISSEFLHSTNIILIYTNKKQLITARIDGCWSDKHMQNNDFRLYNRIKSPISKEYKVSVVIILDNKIIRNIRIDSTQIENLTKIIDDNYSKKHKVKIYSHNGSLFFIRLDGEWINIYKLLTDTNVRFVDIKILD